MTTSSRSKRGIRRLAGEYAALFVGRLGAAVFGVVSLTLLARMLGTGGYGQVTLIVMLGTVISALLLSWPNAAVVKYGREEMETRGMIQEAFWSRGLVFVASASVVGVIVLVFRTELSAYVGLGERTVSGCVWAFAVALALYELSVVALQGADRVAVSGAVHFFAKGLLAALLVVAWIVWEAGLDPATVVVFQVAALLVVGIGALFTIRARLGGPRTTAAAVSRTVGYTWAIVIGSAGGVIVRWVDVTVINHCLDIQAVGAYAVAYQIATFIGMTTASITSVVFPAVVSYKSKGQVDRVHTFIDAIIPQAMLVWNLGLAVLCVAVQVALPLFLGSEYLVSVWPLQLLLVGLGYNAIGRFYTGVTNAFGLLNHVALLSLGVGVINLVGDIILVPRIGIQGAAISTLLAFAITHQSYIFLINRSRELSSSRRRYLVNLFPLAPASVAVAGQIMPLPAQILVLVGSVGGMALIARNARMFTTTTQKWIEDAGLPRFLERRVLSFYSVLAPR